MPLDRGTTMTPLTPDLLLDLCTDGRCLEHEGCVHPESCSAVAIIRTGQASDTDRPERSHP
jgi:hypothetical protein